MTECGEWKWSRGSGIASDEGKLLPNTNAQIDEQRWLAILCHWKVPQFDDLPQKINTGSDRNNDNKNISTSSWDCWIKFCSCQNWTLSSSAWCLELKPPKFHGKGLNCLKYVFLIIYMHIIFFIISIYVGTHF